MIMDFDKFLYFINDVIIKLKLMGLVDQQNKLNKRRKRILKVNLKNLKTFYLGRYNIYDTFIINRCVILLFIFI